MDFMGQLCDPEKNDREWFKTHDAVWRFVSKNWNEFIDHLIPKMMDEVDETLPFLPSKDCVYRIYRDVRLCHDKVSRSVSRYRPEWLESPV